MKKYIALLLSSTFAFCSCGAIEVLAAKRDITSNISFGADNVAMTQPVVISSSESDFATDENSADLSSFSFSADENVPAAKAENAEEIKKLIANIESNIVSSGKAKKSESKNEKSLASRIWNSIKGVVNVENGIKTAGALAIWLLTVAFTFKAYDNLPKNWTELMAKTNEKLSQFHLFREGKYKFILGPIVNNQFVVAGLRDVLQVSDTPHFTAYVKNATKPHVDAAVNCTKTYMDKAVNATKSYFDSIRNVFSHKAA